MTRFARTGLKATDPKRRRAFNSAVVIVIRPINNNCGVKSLNHVVASACSSATPGPVARDRKKRIISGAASQKTPVAIKSTTVRNVITDGTVSSSLSPGRQVRDCIRTGSNVADSTPPSSRS